MFVYHDLYHDHSSRLYYREKGRLHAHNEILELTDRAPSGFGLRVLQQQVQHARRIGVREIHTLAVRNSTMNGYYTWGRYGFDGPLDKRHIARLPEGWKDVEYLSDLMTTEEGREIWSAYGESIRLVFDLAEESYSMQVLRKYLEERKVLPWPL
jgi:hypothetical protein